MSSYEGYEGKDGKYEAVDGNLKFTPISKVETLEGIPEENRMSRELFIRSKECIFDTSEEEEVLDDYDAFGNDRKIMNQWCAENQGVDDE